MISTLNKKLVNTSLQLLLVSLILNITFTSNRASAKTVTQNSIESVDCFDNVKLEANFIAFTTTKGSSLANWYQ